jgi:hypothetical protein
MDTFEFAQRVLRLVAVWRDEAKTETEHPHGGEYHAGYLAALEAVLAGLRGGFQHLFNEQADLLDEDLTEEDRERMQRENELLEQILEDENMIAEIEGEEAINEKEEDNAS